MTGLDEGDLLTAREVGRILRLAPGTLANARSRGEGVPYLKLGTAVRYRRHDVTAWVESQQRTGRAA